MKGTSNTFTVLQATAAIVSLAIVLWSLGLPSFRFAEAANVTSYSDTLSTSEPSVVSNHTLTFTIPTGPGVATGETIVVTFPAGFNMGSVAFADIDLNINSVEQTLAAAPSGATWGAVVAGQVLTFTSGTGVANAGEVVEIQIGTNAAGPGVNQITNPTTGSYEIGLTAGSVDTGATRVAILPVVTVSASVDTIFTFTVGAVGGGVTVNGETTTGTTTATTIPFGKLDPLTASTAAQLLTVNTNAANGFVVTVTADGQLVSSTGADIDGFVEGSYTTTPTTWTSPTPTIGDEWSYGHWGLTTDDGSITTPMGSGEFVSASTSPVEVFRNDGPANGTGVGVGTTTVAYNVEISALQEAADDYTATLTYVATPVF